MILGLLKGCLRLVTLFTGGVVRSQAAGAFNNHMGISRHVAYLNRPIKETV